MTYVLKHKKKALYLCRHKNQIVPDLQKATVYYTDMSAKISLTSHAVKRILKDYQFQVQQFSPHPITLILNE